MFIGNGGLNGECSDKSMSWETEPMEAINKVFGSPKKTSVYLPPPSEGKVGLNEDNAKALENLDTGGIKQE